MSIELERRNIKKISGLQLPTLYVERAVVTNSEIDARLSFFVTIDVDLVSPNSLRDFDSFIAFILFPHLYSV